MRARILYFIIFFFVGFVPGARTCILNTLYSHTHTHTNAYIYVDIFVCDAPPRPSPIVAVAAHLSTLRQRRAFNLNCFGVTSAASSFVLSPFYLLFVFYSFFFFLFSCVARVTSSFCVRFFWVHSFLMVYVPLFFFLRQLSRHFVVFLSLSLSHTLFG